MRSAVTLAALLALGLAAAGAPSRTPPVSLPGGRPGIGFDDLRFAPGYGVLAPGGRSGRLYVVDARTLAVATVDGFSAEATWGGGHDQGATSVDVGDGRFFVTDRTAQKLAVVDAAQKRVVAAVALAASPDYVRYVAPTHEVWVTEPDASQIEVFSLAGAQPTHAAIIATPGGPESLVIDPLRGRAYTHRWRGGTLSLDLRTRRVIEEWPNGCSGSRGIALDAARGLLFAGCAEGRVTAADVAHGGKPLVALAVPARGIDVIDYAPGLHHLYLPGAANATLAIVSVDAAGRLTLVGTQPTVKGAHCVASDDHGRAFVCDPEHGQLLVLPDPAAANGG